MHQKSGQINRRPMGDGEYFLLMALLISIVALSVDTMLPALPAIGADLGVKNANDTQLVISMLFLGLSVGLLFYGPLSDSFGRKPVLFVGMAIYILGNTLSIFSTDYTAMLWGRVLQGLGAAGPRSIVLALVRDRYEGRVMARIMSTIMSIFILVPVFAPALGQTILTVAGWRAIFTVLLVLSLIVLAWFAMRQPETLPPQHRRPFTLEKILAALVEVFRNRVALSYTVVAGCILGVLVGYLSSAQQIFQDLYGQVRLFPVIFGVLALALGIALFFNSRIVMRLGMRKLVRRAMWMIFLLSTVYFAINYLYHGRSPLWMLMVYLFAVFSCTGFLFGNLNAIAMRPLGHIAGTASAVIGALSTFLSVPIGLLIGRLYNSTTIPLVGGFTLISIISLSIMRWTNRGQGEASSIS